MQELLAVHWERRGEGGSTTPDYDEKAQAEPSTGISLEGRGSSLAFPLHFGPHF